MANTLQVSKVIIVEEDIALGDGLISQERNGTVRSYKRVSSVSIPMEDDPSTSVDEAIKALQDGGTGPGDGFDKDEYLVEYIGTEGAGFPIILDPTGKISPTFLDLQGLSYQGPFTPTPLAEYPVGGVIGDFWTLAVDYLWTTGDLSGMQGFANDFMVLGTTGWALLSNDVDLADYYRLDGTTSITADFQAGGHKLINIADGTELSDAVSLSQLGNYFTKPEFIFQRPTTPLGHQPISTTNSGYLDSSFLDLNTLTFMGEFTPTPGPENEYPQNPTAGDTWMIAVDYTWVGGDLIGLTAKPGDLIIYGETGWVLNVRRIDVGDYYRVDGANPLIADFNAGAFRLRSVADGVTDQDATTVKQVVAGLATKANTTHGHTKNEVGLGNVDNTSDLDKPISTDTQNALDLKEDDLGNPTTDGWVLSSLISGVRSWVTRLHNHDTEYFRQDTFIDVSTGIPDSNKPIVLNTEGKLDASFIGFEGLEYQGGFTPTVGLEYPTPAEPGWFWSLDIDYTWVGGDLAGRTGTEGDIILSGSASWGLIESNVDTSIYYKLDGTAPIIADFNAGNFKLVNVADGVLDTDGVTMSQLVAGLATKSDTGHTHTKAEVGLGSVDNTSDLDKPISTATQTALDGKENDLANPAEDGWVLSSTALGARLWKLVADAIHTHTPTEVGLGNVDNTSDIDKPISSATQAALNNKEDDLGNPSTSGFVLASDDLGNRSWVDKSDIDPAEYFTKDEFIDTSLGPVDSGKPVKTNVNGRIDNSMLDFDTLVFVGEFTPVQGTEYPSGAHPGYFYMVAGVDDSIGYTYLTGELVGLTAYNNDLMLYGTSGWVLRSQDITTDWSTITNVPDNVENAVGNYRDLGTQNLNDVTTTGFYAQQSTTNATELANYPIPYAGSLVVHDVVESSPVLNQTYTGYSNNGLFTRGRLSSGVWAEWVEYGQMVFDGTTLNIKLGETF